MWKNWKGSNKIRTILIGKMEEKDKFPETVLDKKNNIEYKLCGIIGSVNILLLLQISVNCLGVCGLYMSIPITSDNRR